MEHSAIFGFDPKIVSTVILVVSYLILFTEKLNRAVVALLGAVVMIFAGVLTQDGAIAGIDFNTLALLIGMMIIVGIAEKSGMFQYVAVWSAKKVRASPRGLLIVLGGRHSRFLCTAGQCYHGSAGSTGDFPDYPQT